MNKTVDISISKLIESSKKDLEGNWGAILGALILYIIISMVSSMIPFASLMIEGPLTLGLTFVALSIVRNKTANFNLLFDGFNYFGKTLGLFILITLATMVGMIFFIIPGIILALGLSQSFYILADNPEMPIVDIMKKSYNMMKGYKVTYFIINFLFGLMAIASIITLGLALLWIIPIASIANAKFYTLINEDEDREFKMEDNLIM